MHLEFGVRARIRFRVRRNRILALTPNSVDVDLPLAELQRRLQGLGDAGAILGGGADPVLDHFEQRLRARVEPRVALPLQELLDLLLAEVLRDRDGKGDDDPLVSPRQQRLIDGRGRVPDDRLAAAAAVELRRPREQELQMVVQLGHRADRRARGAHRVGLVDGDGRRDALDCVDLGLVHAVEELAGVGAEGLDVAPLPLGVQRVEDERRLPRARNAGHHDQLAGRDRQVQVL
jgi:hypothetical protein